MHPTPLTTKVEGGRVRIGNKTLFERNSADSKVGETIHLSQSGSVGYTLPAPPGRWLFVRQGTTFNLDSGGENFDFPYACNA
eukprot:5481723-Prymnesium_polylepis.3